MISSEVMCKLCRFARTTYKPGRYDNNANITYQCWVRGDGKPNHQYISTVIKDYVNGIVSGYRKFTMNEKCIVEADYNPIDIAVQEMFVRRLEKEKSKQ
jgi:hypothetical protein